VRRRPGDIMAPVRARGSLNGAGPNAGRAALFFTSVHHARLYRPAFAEVMFNGPPDDTGWTHPFARLEAEIDYVGS
jgi:hypothetical protein